MKILFVCSGNTCRSPMAEAIFRNFYSQSDSQPEIASAGIYALPGDEASPNAILAMQKRGLDIKNHRSRVVSPYLLEQADIIITMNQSHKEALLLIDPALADKTLAMAEIDGTDINDPYGGVLELYKDCADQIEKSLRILWHRLEEDRLKKTTAQKTSQEKGNED
ncbi:MAG: low molecular weight protein arginine phosphatase [Bacillota bacterium]|jgi:protein-tyrosine-phosphatase